MARRALVLGVWASFVAACHSHDPGVGNNLNLHQAGGGSPATSSLARIDITAPSSVNGQTAVIGDFNSDGLFDVALFPRTGLGAVTIAQQNTTTYDVTLLSSAFAPIDCVESGVAQDFDNDGDTDILLVTCQHPA